jgi:hypothetical protein
MLTAVDNESLLAATVGLVARSNSNEADLLLHLGEVDARRLYAGRGYSSMLTYCTDALGFSLYAALDRIGVARAARHFPHLLDHVRMGKLNITAIKLLSGVLTDENCDNVIARAIGLSIESVKVLVAQLNPKPVVADSIRKRPARATPTERALPSSVPQPAARPAPLASLPVASPAPVAVPTLQLDLTTATPTAVAVPTPAAATAPKPARVEPLAPNAYKVQFTADDELRDLIKQAQELLSHRKDSRDLAAVFKQGLQLLIAKVKKERFGIGARARAKPTASAAPAKVTRHVPAQISRATVERDGLQCTFVSDDGHRCEERSFLQLEHLEGFARTHEHSADTLTVRCATHNQHAAELMYGRAFMDAKRAAGSFKTSAGQLNLATGSAGAPPT